MRHELNVHLKKKDHKFAKCTKRNTDAEYVLQRVLCHLPFRLCDVHESMLRWWRRDRIL